MADNNSVQLSRRNCLTGVGTGIAAALAGCTGNSDPDEGSSSSPDGGNAKQDLKFWLFGGIPAEREYTSSHYKSYSTHNVSYEHKVWGKKHQIVASAAANNNPRMPHHHRQGHRTAINHNVQKHRYEGEIQ